jgi:hypothetical protein
LRRLEDVIAAATDWLEQPIDVMHSSGALQYAADPECILRQLFGLARAA